MNSKANSLGEMGLVLLCGTLKCLLEQRTPRLTLDLCDQLIDHFV